MYSQGICRPFYLRVPHGVSSIYDAFYKICNGVVKICSIAGICGIPVRRRGIFEYTEYLSFRQDS